MCEDTEILTGKGIKKLKDLNGIEKVKSFDFDTDKIVDSKAEVFDTGLKDVYEVVLDDGRKVQATKDHKFFVKRNKVMVELRLENIREGDDLVCVKENGLK